MADSSIKNIDVAYLADILSVQLRELNKCQSSFVGGVVITADRNRVLAYAAEVQSAIDFIVNKSNTAVAGTFGSLDLARSHPRDYTLQPNAIDAEAGVENAVIRNLIRHFSALRAELVHSNSSQIASGLLPADRSRAEEVLERINRFVTDYIDTLLPADAPETGPQPNPQRTGR